MQVLPIPDLINKVIIYESAFISLWFEICFLLKLILVHNTLGIIKNFSELNHSMIFLNISYNESTYCYMLWWWSKVEKLGTDSQMQENIEADCIGSLHSTQRACISGVTSWSYKLTRNTSYYRIGGYNMLAVYKNLRVFWWRFIEIFGIFAPKSLM